MAWNQRNQANGRHSSGWGAVTQILLGAGWLVVASSAALASGEGAPPETFAPFHESVAEESSSSPQDVPPLPTVEEVPSEMTTPGEASQELFELPPSPSEETSSPAAPSPDALVGQDIEATLTDLTANGWMLVVYTPRQAQLDRGEQGLNLYIDPANGKITEAEVISLF